MTPKKGNKNALKHGFYSKNFTAQRKKDLSQIDPVDITHEIELIRDCLSKLQEELDFKEKKKTDSHGNTYRDDHYLQQLNTLSIMAGAVSTLARTQYLIKGKSGDVYDSIMQALEEIRIDLGI
jgi:hypothetical protein